MGVSINFQSLMLNLHNYHKSSLGCSGPRWKRSGGKAIGKCHFLEECVGLIAGIVMIKNNCVVLETMLSKTCPCV